MARPASSAARGDAPVWLASLLASAWCAASTEAVSACAARPAAARYDGVGHVPHLEEPGRFNRELAALTRRVRG